MILYLLNRAMWILLLAAVIAAVWWLNVTDRQAEQAAQREYCEAVVTWEVEAARGIDPLHRTGHPDYDQRAADDCPGMQPAINRSEIPNSSPRQLARE